jgi:hypothetical protein
MPVLMSTLCVIFGFVALVVGIALVSIPLALVVGGALLIAAGVMAE